MIDWSKDWNDTQVLEIDPEWVDRIKRYDFKGDTFVQELLKNNRLFMECRPLEYKPSDYGPTRYSMVKVDQIVARVTKIKSLKGEINIEFWKEEIFERFKSAAEIDDRILVATPRCFINATTKEIGKFVTFDIMRKRK